MIDEVAVYDTALDEKEAQVGASLTANTTKVMHSLQENDHELDY